MIGIVLPIAVYNHEIKLCHEKSSIYNHYKIMAKKFQVDMCMYSFRQISKNLKMVEALVYSCRQDNLIWKKVMVPRVNIVRNTSYVRDQQQINRFKRLRSQNIHFINFPIYRQANKLKNYMYLQSHELLKYHVPATKRLSYRQLEAFIRQYGKVIIKPIYGSKGRGITIIEKDSDQYKVCRTPFSKNDSDSNGSHKLASFPHPQLKQFYQENFLNPSSFLVQQWIDFKQFKGRPYDIRAVVQKNGKNQWQLTSRVARVANGKGQITNLNQGGEMVSFPRLQLQKYQGEIFEFCLETANIFANLYPWTAEMGIDLAIDKSNKLWYIETNFCPEKIRYTTTYRIPFEYAYYLYTRELSGSVSKGQYPPGLPAGS